MLRYSTVLAALILAGGVVTASAASKTTHHPHRYHGLYLQTPSSGQTQPYGDRYDRAPQYNTQDDYITDHAKGAVKDD